MKIKFFAEEDNFVIGADFEATTLDDVLNRFTSFLRGAGFHFDGEIVLETEGEGE